MKILKSVFKWLSGKKTIIGLSLLALCGQDFFSNNIHPDIVQAIEWIGGILSGVGIGHKILKMEKKRSIKN